MIESSYEIKIEFPEDTEKPERLFRTAAKLIESFGILDEGILQTVSSGADSTLVLRDIRKGSLIATLMRKIEQPSQSQLGSHDEEKVPEYLTASREIVAKGIGGLNGDNSHAVIQDIAQKIESLAEQTGIKQAFQYAPIPKLKLGKAVEGIINSTSELTENEKALISSNFAAAADEFPTIDIPRGKSIDIRQIESALTERTIENTVKVILVIKKPDFLGTSQWVFKHGNDSNLNAKISDKPWLDSFHHRQITIAPSDALECDMKETATYDKHGNMISMTREILKVHKISMVANNG